MKDKRYITQVTGQDMKELEQLTNMEPGWLIRIEKSQGKLQIGIDPNALAQAINGFFRNGGCNTNAAGCVTVPFEPPS